MHTILIVEDEKATQNNIEILLLAEGYSVLTADNGLEALKVLETMIPDLIVTSVGVPYVSGYELYDRLSRDARYCSLPVIFLSGSEDSISAPNDFYALGPCLTKPFEFTELLVCIKEQLEASSEKPYMRKIDAEVIQKYISHEVNTPLVAIQGFSELLSNSEEPLTHDEVVYYAAKISRAAKNLQLKNEKLSWLYYLQSLPPAIIQQMRRSSVVIDNELIAGIANQASAGNGEAIVFDIQPARLSIQADYLFFILRELLENSSRFSRRSSQVRINGCWNGLVYQLSVTDSGIGIAPEQIALIEDLCTNSELDGWNGSGLGMVLIINMIRLFSITLKITSIPHVQTVVQLSFPCPVGITQIKQN